MNTIRASALIAVVLSLLLCVATEGIRADVPQEHYFPVGSGIVAGPSPAGLLGTASGQILLQYSGGLRLFAIDGTPLAQYANTFPSGDYQGAVPLADGNILFIPGVAPFTSSCMIETLDAQLNDLHLFTAGGTPPCSYTAFELANTHVVVVNFLQNSVTIYTSANNDVGTVYKQWDIDFAPGQKAVFVQGFGYAIGNRIFIQASDGYGSRMQEYDEDGNILYQAPCPQPNNYGVAIDGQYYRGPYYSPVLDMNCNVVGEGNDAEGVVEGITAKVGKFYVSFGNDSPRTIRVSAKGYRSTGSYFTNDVPSPVVVSVVPRPGTTILDTSYIVYDKDAPTVRTAALAFLGGSFDLSNVVRMSTLVDGTDTHVGANVATNTSQLISWNAGADIVGRGSFQPATIWVFANDGRGLIDLHFITIPADVPAGFSYPTLTISDTPIRQIDMTWAWYWLIGTNDPEITFANGQITAASGPFAGQVLASGGITTTAAGINFLLARLNVRAATAAEVTRARRGSSNAPLPGNQYQTLKRAEIPLLTNEIGFDTGSTDTDGVWVVPL